MRLNLNHRTCKMLKAISDHLGWMLQKDLDQHPVRTDDGLTSKYLDRWAPALPHVSHFNVHRNRSTERRESGQSDLNYENDGGV